MPSEAQAWPDADRLFRRDRRWRGGDDAYSIALSPGRTLWLFGDSFIAAYPNAPRRECTMIHNSIAIQDGSDPTTARMRFCWRDGGAGAPASYFAEQGREWFWPGDGVRIGEVLVILLMRVRVAANPEQVVDPIELWRRTDALSFFEVIGWDARVVLNPDDEPEQWRVEGATLPLWSGCCVGSAGVHVRGDELYAAGFHPSDPARRWQASVWRWRVADAIRGDLSTPLDGDTPCAELHDAPTEFTIHETDGQLVQVQVTGTVAPDIAVRSAPRITGPWTPLSGVFHPPESDRAGVLVYAAKAHPEQDAGAGLAVTYASIGMSADRTLDDEGLYYPRFVRTSLG